MHCPAVFGLGVPFPAPLSERDSQTVVFFVSVLLVNLLLQCVFTSLSHGLDPLTTFVMPLVQRWEIQLHGRSSADRLVFGY
jgi:hypothetical protein